MDAVVRDKSGSQSKSEILVWFDWAERLTTGLGSKDELSAVQEDNFDAVLHSAVRALHHRPGDRLSDAVSSAIDANPVKSPVKLVSQQSHQVTLETITLFMLERLASRGDEVAQERAYDIAEDLRAVTTPRSIFSAQLQLFQIALIEGNPNLEGRGVEELGNKKELQAIAGAQRSINPASYSGEVYARADGLMRNFFKRDIRLEAA